MSMRFILTQKWPLRPPDMFRQIAPHAQMSCASLDKPCALLLHDKPLQLQQRRNVAQSRLDKESEIAAGNRKIIAKLAGITVADVTRTPAKPIIEKNASNVLNVLQKFGFPTGSIRLHPKLLLMTGGAVENYIRIMQESGFPDVREGFILRFRSIYKENIVMLQQRSLLPKLSDIIDRYCDELEEKNSFAIEIANQLPRDTTRLSLFDFRCHIFSAYFMKISDASKEQTLLSLKKYPRLAFRSLNWIRRVNQMLKDLEFKEDTIRKHSYLLYADPYNMARLGNEIGSLGGIELKKIVHLRPKIVMSACDSLKEIDKSLQESGISHEAILKYPEIFTLSSPTIRKRLEEIETTPEFKSLKCHPRIVRLLYYQKKAKSRLDEFKTMQIRAPFPSLHMLSSDNKKFRKSVLSGDVRVRGVDVIINLSEILQVDKLRIRESILRHPHWLHIPLVNMIAVLKYLRTISAFSTDQLVDALPIVLYSPEKVEKELNNVINSGEAKVTDEYFLQMILYFLERPSHFNGDGVWTAEMRHEEEADVQLEVEDDEESIHEHDEETRLDGKVI